MSALVYFRLYTLSRIYSPLAVFRSAKSNAEACQSRPLQLITSGKPPIRCSDKQSSARIREITIQFSELNGSVVQSAAMRRLVKSASKY